MNKRNSGKRVIVYRIGQQSGRMEFGAEKRAFWRWLWRPVPSFHYTYWILLLSALPVAVTAAIFWLLIILAAY